MYYIYKYIYISLCMYLCSFNVRREGGKERETERDGTLIQEPIPTWIPNPEIGKSLIKSGIEFAYN